MINIIKDINIVDDIGKYDSIIVGVNTNCSMYHGIQRPISLNYPYVLEANMKTKYCDKNKLGTILECSEKDEPTFTLAFITHGLNTRPDLKSEYLSYEALESCLKLINILYKDKNIATTVIGGSPFDGNGNRERILEMLSSLVIKPNLTVYDFTELSRDEQIKLWYKKEKKLKETDITAYYAAIRERKRIANERFKKNGHARY